MIIHNQSSNSFLPTINTIPPAICIIIAGQSVFAYFVDFRLRLLPSILIFLRPFDLALREGKLEVISLKPLSRYSDYEY